MILSLLLIVAMILKRRQLQVSITIFHAWNMNMWYVKYQFCDARAIFWARAIYAVICEGNEIPIPISLVKVWNFDRSTWLIFHAPRLIGTRPNRDEEEEWCIRCRFGSYSWLCGIYGFHQQKSVPETRGKLLKYSPWDRWMNSFGLGL